MKTNRPHIFLIKIMFFALLISGIPLPNTFQLVSPFWVLLFYIYWTIYFPAHGVFFLALIFGILLDILQGSLLGQNALALIISTAFIVNVKQSFYVSNISTQQVYMFIAGSIYLVLFLLTHILIQGLNFSWTILLAPLTTALFWPAIKLILSKLKH
jgi:rod shape-determining protein MreD